MHAAPLGVLQQQPAWLAWHLQQGSMLESWLTQHLQHGLPGICSMAAWLAWHLQQGSMFESWLTRHLQQGLPGTCSMAAWLAWHLQQGGMYVGELHGVGPCTVYDRGAYRALQCLTLEGPAVFDTVQSADDVAPVLLASAACTRLCVM